LKRLSERFNLKKIEPLRADFQENPRRDVAPKYEVFREARRNRVFAAADKSKPNGRGFDLKIE
jgi:hypothetical protein